MLVHRDDVLRRADGDAWRYLGPERLAYCVLAADEDEVRQTAFFPIQQSAPDYLVRGVVAAHRVDGDFHQSAAVLSRRPLRLDRYDLAAAEHPAMRARLVRRLRALALWARNEVHRAQREMTAALALRRARYPFLGLACQSVLLVGVSMILEARPTRGQRSGWNSLSLARLLHRSSTGASWSCGSSLRSRPHTRQSPLQSGLQSGASGVARISSSRRSGVRSILKSLPMRLESAGGASFGSPLTTSIDRKSTRLNSSHRCIS